LVVFGLVPGVVVDDAVGAAVVRVVAMRVTVVSVVAVRVAVVRVAVVRGVAKRNELNMMTYRSSRYHFIFDNT